MTYNLGDITTKVQQRVRDTNYSSTEIVGYINDAQNDVFNEYSLPFMQSVQSYTVTANVSDITNGAGLPTNYVQAINLTVTTDSKEKLIEFMPYRVLDTLYPDPTDVLAHTPGLPIYWYFYNDTIRLFPAPDNAYIVSLQYNKKPTELTVDGDIPEVPSEFREALVMGAAYRVLQVKDNYDQASVLQNKYDEILQKMVVRYSQAQVGVATQIRINRRHVGRQQF